jgi:hypothetical protein
MAKRVARIKSLVGLNPIELDRRLNLVRQHKDSIAGWFKLANVSRARIRAYLIELLELDTGDMTSLEAASTRIRAFSAFFYGSHLETQADYDEVTTKLIDALGDTAEFFFRERQGPYGPRAAYKERTSATVITGDLVKVFNDSYITVETVPNDSSDQSNQDETNVSSQEQEKQAAEDKALEYYLLDSMPQNDCDKLVENILLALYSAADKTVLTPFILETDPYSELLNLDCDNYSDTLIRELSKTTAAGFLNRLRKLLLLK